jgi:Uma2 family endonuclease
MSGGLAIHEQPMSIEEWAALDEDEPGELIDARLVEEEMPTFIHEAVVLWLGAILRAWAAERGGVIGGSEVKYAVRPHRGRKPDLSLFVAGRLPPGRARLVRKPPDIAVEVVTPRPRDARRDRVEKLDEYAAFGVRYYWIVDPGLRALEVFELGADGRYARALGVTSGVVTAVPGCEGLTFDLDELWREVERLEAIVDDAAETDEGDA